jgi:ribosome-binding protein aMBF1 (putative translation factor)
MKTLGQNSSPSLLSMAVKVQVATYDPKRKRRVRGAIHLMAWQRRAIATETECTEKTIRKWERGEEILEATRRRIEKAVKKLDFIDVVKARQGTE